MLIFITLIVTLFVYNTFLFLFTKDKAYLYYVFYLLSSLLSNLTRTGMIQYYLISEKFSALFQQTIPLIQALFLVSIVLFVRVTVLPRQVACCFYLSCAMRTTCRSTLKHEMGRRRGGGETKQEH